MSEAAVCPTCNGPLDQVGVIWEMGYRVASQHACGGDPVVCATTCPVPTPDIELIPAPCPAEGHPRVWTEQPA